MRCTPNPGQGEGVFFMSKFTLEFKLECIEMFKKHKFWSGIVFFSSHLRFYRTIYILLSMEGGKIPFSFPNFY